MHTALSQPCCLLQVLLKGQHRLHQMQQEQSIKFSMQLVNRLQQLQCHSPTGGVMLGDAQHRYQKLKFRHNLYKLREERNIKPSTFGELVSSMLYEKR